MNPPSLNPPLISIIIPTFNAETKIAASLSSIVNHQGDFEAFEIIVMDGASRDATPAIASEWAAHDSRISVQSEPDTGVYEAMNRGVARAQGEFLFFLGAGDLVRPGALSQIAALLPPRGTKLRVVYGDICSPDGSIYDGPFSASKLRTQNIGHQAIFYERQIFARLGGYDTRYRSYADHVFNLKCWGSRAVAPLYCPVVVADYEGAGLSDDGDPLYDRDRMKILWHTLGARQYLLALIAKILPSQLKTYLRLSSRQRRKKAAK